MKINFVMLLLLFLIINGVAQVQPSLLGEGVISTSLDDLNAAFTKDGKTVYFSVNSAGDKMGIILYSELMKGKWAQPKVGSFSGEYSDYDPYFTADQQKLFFISNRPVDGKPRTDYDIYYVERVGNSWGEVKSVGSNVNDSKNQFYPSLVANGNLYFSSNRDSGYDLYVSKWVNGEYQTPERLPGKINDLKTMEGDVVVAADESFLVVAIYGRADTYGSGDLYISYNVNQEWTEPKNPGKPINSSTREYCPIFSPDGKIFYFTSYRGKLDEALQEPYKTFDQINADFNAILNGRGNIYQISSGEVLKK